MKNEEQREKGKRSTANADTRTVKIVLMILARYFCNKRQKADKTR